MPLSDDEYRELLQSLRRTMRQAGLASLDERILSELRGSEGPFYDLTIYLKLLTSEVSLGSDEHLRSILRRVRHAAGTESGEPIQGVRVQLSPEESRLYNTDSLDFAPSPEISEVVSELRAVLEELHSDWQNRSNRG